MAQVSSEVAPGLHRVVMPVGDRLNSCYAFVGSSRILLFDTATAGDINGYVAPYLSSIGRDIGDVHLAVISHGDIDHFGGAAQLHEMSPATLIACHHGDHHLMLDPLRVFNIRYNELNSDGLAETAEFAQWCQANARPAPVDLMLAGGEQIVLEQDWAVQVLHVPGHSRGHLAIWDPRSRALVVSDAVLGDGVPLANGAPAFPPTYRYVADYLATIQVLTALNADLLLTAHYPTMAADQAAAFLKLSDDYTGRVNDAVMDFIEATIQPSTVEQVVHGTAARLGPWPMVSTAAALGQPIIGHLEWLTARRWLVLDSTGEIRRWSKS